MAELNLWFDTETKKTANFKDVQQASMIPEKSTISRGGNQSRRNSVSNNQTQSNIALYENVTEEAKTGVETTKKILKDVKLMNMKLDDITDLVRLQRQKLLNLHQEIEKSQNYVNQAGAIVRSFSKELYGDKIIFTLVALITIILVFIVIASIKYKLKSDIIIGENTEGNALDNDYSIIDEKLFWKNTFAEEKAKDFTRKEFEGQESLKNFIIAERMKEIEEAIQKIQLESSGINVLKDTQMAAVVKKVSTQTDTSEGVTKPNEQKVESATQTKEENTNEKKETVNLV
jgi:hypothetical protein